MDKAPDAFRTISEAAEELDVPQHVLRFWETRFSQVRPMKRAGGRRYYRPQDIDLLRGIRRLLYDEGYTIKGVQKILRQHGIAHVVAVGREEVELVPAAGMSVVPAANRPVRNQARTTGASSSMHGKSGDEGNGTAKVVKAAVQAAPANNPDLLRAPDPTLSSVQKAALQEALAALEQAHGVLQGMVKAAEALEQQVANILAHMTCEE